MDIKPTYAPIVLFVYDRLWHTQQTISALQLNKISSDSELFIYSDGPKNDKSRENVAKVREYIKTIEGFNKITIVIREKNLGLAKSIIEGVSNVIDKYGKVIVLEDDIVTSPSFLKFMNDALNFYENEEKVWHITGWNYPIENNDMSTAFLWRLMNCWGWGTWKDKWKHFDKNVNKVMEDFSKNEINKFDLDGFEAYWSQVIHNKKGMIDTWAVFWYISIFKANGLCLNPATSYVKNIGFDGSGVHCGKSDMKYLELNKNYNTIFPTSMLENENVVNDIKKYLKSNKKSVLRRIAIKLKSIIFMRIANSLF